MRGFLRAEPPRPLLGVFASKHEPGLRAFSERKPQTWVWPRCARNNVGVRDAAEVVDLETALARQHQTDAHAVPYVVVRRADGAVLARHPRVNIDGLALVRQAGFDLRFTRALADIDNEGHAPWTEATIQSVLPKLCHPFLADCVVLTTRAGLRIIRVHDRWLSLEQYAEWLRGWLRDMKAATGLVPDERCIDWTRMYLLPRVVPHHPDVIVPTEAPLILWQCGESAENTLRRRRSGQSYGEH